MKLKDLTIGLGITGSFCNFKDMKEIITTLQEEGAKDVAIASGRVAGVDGKTEENTTVTTKIGGNGRCSYGWT